MVLDEGLRSVGPGGDAIDLDNIKTQLDLVLLALEALTGLGSEAILQAASELKLVDFVSDRVGLWRLRQSNPLRRGSGGRKKLDIEEARSLVLISTHLARNHQTQIRQAIEHWETLEKEARSPQQDPLLGDYLDAFTGLYQERMSHQGVVGEDLSELALSLLIDLLFYSSPQGSRRMWLALLDRTQAQI
ncbi:DUF3038 domain-containing protein [Synechococcus sp. PCC 6312]|uniref:DUF3038 domain-containing protein n=1 Tax=Synechococcus sp. (strain ATCC 27167 / PCC 6312) TaxID=195253 RepID=UPI00029F22F5|nr:Protein of unknown function (DUF3038) [Synechococcus sp. PCC 6312]